MRAFSFFLPLSLFLSYSVSPHYFLLHPFESFPCSPYPLFTVSFRPLHNSSLHFSIPHSFLSLLVPLRRFLLSCCSFLFTRPFYTLFTLSWRISLSPYHNGCLSSASSQASHAPSSSQAAFDWWMLQGKVKILLMTLGLARTGFVYQVHLNSIIRMSEWATVSCYTSQEVTHASKYYR